MQSIKLWRFTRELFDDAGQAAQAAAILQAQLQARSPRLTDIARAMSGKPESNYKRLHRFLHKVDLKADAALGDAVSGTRLAVPFHHLFVAHARTGSDFAQSGT